MQLDEDARDHVLSTLSSDGAGYFYRLDPESMSPSACTTFGWSINFGLPEVIALGTYAQALQRFPLAIDEFPEAVGENGVIRDGQKWPMEVNGHPLCGRVVHLSQLARPWFTEARFARGYMRLPSEFDAYQLFWADDAGRYPSESQCQEFCRELQPFLFQAA